MRDLNAYDFTILKAGITDNEKVIINILENLGIIEFKEFTLPNGKISHIQDNCNRCCAKIHPLIYADEDMTPVRYMELVESGRKYCVVCAKGILKMYVDNTGGQLRIPF